MKKIVNIIYIYDDGTFNNVNVPTLPVSPPVVNNNSQPWTPPYNPAPLWYGSCPTCNLELNKVMGYVCPHAACPTGLGGIQCNSAS